MKASAIVVTYNRLKLLKECLKNLLNQGSYLNNIYVINNNSSDGTFEYLNNLNNPKIVVKNLHSNIGGAGGFSVGTKLAFEQSNSDYFWLMDDDTMPSKDALYQLIHSAKLLHNNFGFLCSNVRWWKDNRAVNVPTVDSNWSELISKALIRVKEASFVSFFVPRKNVKTYGLPIAEAFIWGDDVEYSCRLSNRHPCYFVPNSIVYHKSNEINYDENVFNETYNRIPFYKCFFRNDLYIDRKYFPKGRLLKNILKMTITLLEIPFKANNHKLMRMRYTFSGIINGLIFNPQIRFPKK